MPQIFDTPLVNPVAGGLYVAATLIDQPEPVRLFDGITLRSLNCGTGYGYWDIECGAEGNPTKTGARADDQEFTGFAVWAADGCGLKAVSRQESTAAATQKLRLHEQDLVEARFATTILAAAGVIPAPAAGGAEQFVRAVGELEALLGRVPGVLHADAHFQAWADRYSLNRNGLTPRGHRWAFGGGYGALGSNIVATGPCFVHRGPIYQPLEAFDVTHNDEVVVVEREILPSFECAAVGRIAA